MMTGKMIALTRRAFVGQVMSLLFKMLSRLVIDFLPRSKFLLLSWLYAGAALQREAVELPSPKPRGPKER